MILSEQHRFIFIHLIKTAGTSVTSALRSFGKTHKEIGQGYTCHDNAPLLISRLGRDVFKSYFTFAFVRNPWDMQVSLYHYILRSPKNQSHAIVKGFSGFEEYIRWACHPGAKCQRDHLFSGDEQLVDFIGRYEAMERDFKSICARIGIRADLPRLNVSQRKAFQSYYPPALVDVVAEAYEKDIRQFGYCFEQPYSCRINAGGNMETKSSPP